MTETRRENLITAMNSDHYHNGNRCFIINVDFNGDQVIVEYSAKKFATEPDHTKYFGSVD